MRVLLWKEVLEQWRSYRFLVVAAVFVLMGILGPLTARYMTELLTALPGTPEGLAAVLPKPDVAMAVGELVDNTAQFGLLLALLVPMGAVVVEKTSGTAGMTLSKPVSRGSFLLAKWLALAITFGLGIVLGIAAGYAYTGMLFEWRPPLGFVGLAGLLLAYVLFYASIALLASTLMRSQLAAAGGAVGIAVVVGVLGTVPVLGPWLPAALIPWARAMALGQSVAPTWGALGVTLGAIPVTLAAGWYALWRQEF